MEMIGFVGLGTIGGAIARNIRQAGYPMIVHDIVPEATRPLVEGGARSAESPSGGRPTLSGNLHLPPGSAGSGGSGPRARRPLAGSSRRQCLCGSFEQQPGPHTAHRGRVPVARRAGHGCAAHCRQRLELPTEAYRCWRPGPFETYEKVKSHPRYIRRHRRLYGRAGKRNRDQVGAQPGSSWNRPGDRRRDRLGRQGRGGSPAPLGLHALGP